MRMNIKTQYGLLLVLYIYRAGRATVGTIAANLDMSPTFLTQVAAKLRRSGIIKSIRGPSGGYEVVGAPTVGDVYFALNTSGVLTLKEISCYYRGEFEHRALARCVEDLHFQLNPVFRRKIVDVGTELIQAETHMMEQANTNKAH